MWGSETYTTFNSLAVWGRMAPITLAEMRHVKLMNRIDTKYVLSYDEVVALLERSASAGYRVQHIDNARATRARLPQRT